MSQQIIRQPDGKYSIFSTIVDNFILIDATPEDILDWRIERYRETEKEEISRIVSILENGGKPYLNFTLTYSQAVELIKLVHRKTPKEVH